MSAQTGPDAVADLPLTAKQIEYRDCACDYARQNILPHADAFDRAESLPREVLDSLSREGYLGASVPAEYGGTGRDAIEVGLLHEAIGMSCSSVRSILTVHGMVCEALLRWGSPRQRARWLPRLASGVTIGAFALSEPEAGTDWNAIRACARRQGDSFALTGTKKWITAAQIADLFLVFVNCDGQPIAFLVERDRPGVSVTPSSGLLGLRASLAGQLWLEGCALPGENAVGGIGFGLTAVAASALDFGRYTVAWGCVGIGQACLNESMAYARERRQFGSPIRDHQLVARMISDMVANVAAARLVCYNAGRLREAKAPTALLSGCVAKYFASRACAEIASDAVQIHGARGCSEESSASRHYRDAKVMEIIEGSTEMQQVIIARLAYELQ